MSSEYVNIEGGFVGVRPSPIWRDTPFTSESTISQEDIAKAISDWQENNTDSDNLLEAEIKGE